MRKMKATAFTTENSNKKRTYNKNLGLYAKLVACTAACVLVLVAKIADENNSLVTDVELGAQYQSVAGMNENDELGKLQFVELPGILEVFSPSHKQKLPIKSRETTQNDNGITVISDMEQYVSVFGDCRVKKAEGNTVELVFDGDVEVSYTGDMSVSVEEGQRLKEGDTIGKIAAGEGLKIETKLSGRPVNPREVFLTD